MKIKKILFVIIVVMAFTSCKPKKTNPAPAATPVPIISSNYFSFKIGSANCSLSNITGQQYVSSPDTSLSISASNGSDTVTAGFYLFAPKLGTYIHTNTIGSPLHYIIVNFGNTGSPHLTFYSSSGTITTTTYDYINNYFVGTFSGIMYLSSNPSYTLPITNGSFYLKN